MSLGNKDRNDALNDFINLNVKHMRNGSIPKEYETIISNLNEVFNYIICKYM